MRINHLLADDFHEISYLIFQKLGEMSQNLSSAALVYWRFKCLNNAGALALILKKACYFM